MFCFLAFLTVFLTLRRCFLSALKALLILVTQNKNLLKRVNNVNPRLKSGTYSTFKNVSVTLNRGRCFTLGRRLFKKKKLTWKPFLFVSKTKQVYNFFIIFFILIKQLTVFIGLFNVRHSCFKWIFFTLYNIKFWGQNIRILEVPVFFEAINFIKNLSKKKKEKCIIHFKLLLFKTFWNIACTEKTHSYIW